MPQENKEIDELIRDITSVGFMAKSEARRRIQSVLDKQRNEVIKLIEGRRPVKFELKGYGSNELASEVLLDTINIFVDELLTEIKKG